MMNWSMRSMRFRFHRAGYAESMDTAISLDPTVDALVEAVNNSGEYNRTLTEEDITFERVGYNDRNGWVEYAVIAENLTVVGYTNHVPSILDT